jgi:hypothetical protein
MKCSRNKFWLEHPANLFCDYTLLPLEGMVVAQQMNALTRLVFAVFLVLLLLGIKFSFIFLLLAMLFIIILYYIQKTNMEALKTEHFTADKHRHAPHPSPQHRHAPHPSPQHRHAGVPVPARHPAKESRLSLDPRTGYVTYDNPTSKLFCDDARPLDGPNGAYNNPEWMSVNQKLVGPGNPKTLIAPVVVPPPADLSYWRANNLVTHSAVNDETQIDVYKSGYQVTTCCAPTWDCGESCPTAVPAPGPLGYQVFLKENYGSVDEGRAEPRVKENFEVPYLKDTGEEETMYVRPNGPGQVNTACGYNPEQLFTADLPTNLGAGNCAKDPVMREFNHNLFTQTIQPDVYTTNQINEPINANIGISFDQQFPPTTCTTDEVTGVVNYTEHDPRIMEPVIEEPNLSVATAVTEANVYDPRYTGYGTSYRAYTDDQLGQPRFYYDDVDAIRMPNYVVRSDIDHQPFADQYGPIPEGNSNGNQYNSVIKALANDAFLQGTIQFRTELQERLMRKRNSEMWQLRKAPVRTGGQRMGGGTGCGA